MELIKLLSGMINIKTSSTKETKNLKYLNENNYLIKQYISDKKMRIRHNYFSEQFNNSKEIFKLINKTVKFNDFTLGRYVDLFEKELQISKS